PLRMWRCSLRRDSRYTRPAPFLRQAAAERPRPSSPVSSQPTFTMRLSKIGSRSSTQPVARFIERRAVGARLLRGVRIFAPGTRPRAGGFGERRVGLVLEPALHVAEAVLIGDQLNKSLVAESIELADFLRRHRRGILPHDAVPPIGECVLRIELELIDLERRQP